MPLLQRPWQLHDITDVERFCSRIIERRNLDLRYHDQEELLAYLIETCWELSQTGEWSRSFSGWVHPYLRARVVDWQRQRNGRTKWTFRDRVYERQLPVVVSLDADDSLRDRLDESVAGSSLDGDALGFAADMRILDKRGRRPGRRNNWLGDEAA
jgi:hypothetical protein